MRQHALDKRPVKSSSSESDEPCPFPSQGSSWVLIKVCVPPRQEESKRHLLQESVLFPTQWYIEREARLAFDWAWKMHLARSEGSEAAEERKTCLAGEGAQSRQCLPPTQWNSKRYCCHNAEQVTGLAITTEFPLLHQPAIRLKISSSIWSPCVYNAIVSAHIVSILATHPL